MAHPQNSPRGLFQKAGVIAGPVAAIPSARGESYKVIFITNSTGKNYIAINTTGTTWRYCSVTSVAPY